jgi:hypothetical protein
MRCQLQQLQNIVLTSCWSIDADNEHITKLLYQHKLFIRQLERLGLSEDRINMVEQSCGGYLINQGSLDLTILVKT